MCYQKKIKNAQAKQMAGKVVQKNGNKVVIKKFLIWLYHQLHFVVYWHFFALGYVLAVAVNQHKTDVGEKKPLKCLHFKKLITPSSCEALCVFKTSTILIIKLLTCADDRLMMIPN